MCPTSASISTGLYSLHSPSRRSLAGTASRPCGNDPSRKANGVPRRRQSVPRASALAPAAAIDSGLVTADGPASPFGAQAVDMTSWAEASFRPSHCRRAAGCRHGSGYPRGIRQSRERSLRTRSIVDAIIPSFVRYCLHRAVLGDHLPARGRRRAMAALPSGGSVTCGNNRESGISAESQSTADRQVKRVSAADQ